MLDVSDEAAAAAPTRGKSQPHPAMTFTQRYFGMDGKGKVSYEQFAGMVREMNQTVLRHKWMSMSPSSSGNDTVSLVSILACIW